MRLQRLGRWLQGCAVLALLVACVGDHRDPMGPADSAQLVMASPEEMLAYVKVRLRERLAAEAASPQIVLVTGLAPAGQNPASAVPVATAVDRLDSALAERNIAEATAVATDGSLIYLGNGSLQPGYGWLELRRREAGGALSMAGSIRYLRPRNDLIMGGGGAFLADHGLLLGFAPQRVAAIGSVAGGVTSQTRRPCALVFPTTCVPTWNMFTYEFAGPQVQLAIVDVANAEVPTLAGLIRIDGRFVGARQIGSMLYLITQYDPRLPTDLFPGTLSPSPLYPYPPLPFSERDALIEQVTFDHLIPKLTIEGQAPTPLVDTGCHLQPHNGSLGIEITSVTAIDLASPTLAHASRCVVGGSEAMYVATAAVYWATTRQRYAYRPGATSRMSAWDLDPDASTDVHKFVLDPFAVAYRGSGEVRGHLGFSLGDRSSRMNEWQGDLRVLSYTGTTGWRGNANADMISQPPPSPARLTVLRERTEDRSLQALATLPSVRRPEPLVAPDQQVYAVYFAGPRALARDFDDGHAAFVLDLATPADPRVAAQLAGAGFVDRLVPFSGDLALAFDYQPPRAVWPTLASFRMALLDLADADHPVVAGEITLANAGGRSEVVSANGTIGSVAVTFVLYEELFGCSSNCNPTIWESSVMKAEVDIAARALSLRSVSIDEPHDFGLYMSSVLPWKPRPNAPLLIGDQVYVPTGYTINATGFRVVNWSCFPPPDGLTGWWPGDGNTDDIVGRRGALLGGNATTGAGLVDRAFILDGDGDFVQVPHDPALNFGVNDFTVALWVYFNNTDGEQVLIEKWIQRDPGPIGWTLTKLYDNVLRLALATGDGNETAVDSNVLSIPTATWIHFAATRRGSHVTLLMDGVPVAEAVMPPLDLDSDSSVKFGHRGSPSDTPDSEDTREFYLNGRIDEVELFVGRALPSGLIQAIVNVGSAGDCKRGLC